MYATVKLKTHVEILAELNISCFFCFNANFIVNTL